jgi:hypothetical protein
MTTGVEMLARSRFNQVEECNILLSKLTSNDKRMLEYRHSMNG